MRGGRRAERRCWIARYGRLGRTGRDSPRGPSCKRPTPRRRVDAPPRETSGSAADSTSRFPLPCADLQDLDPGKRRAHRRPLDEPRRPVAAASLEQAVEGGLEDDRRGQGLGYVEDILEVVDVVTARSEERRV